MNVNEDKIKLLDSFSNFAVVQLPNRKFPGVVIQGDSLRILLDLVCELIDSEHSSDRKDLELELLEELQWRVKEYEKVLKKKYIQPPYNIS